MRLWVPVSLAKSNFKTWFLAIETWQCLISTIMALRKCYHQYALAGRIQQCFSFSSWHCDFQVPHTSCLDAKNRFPQGWAKAGDNALCKYQRRSFDIQYLQSKGRDEMLLIKVSMIKSLFRFFETTEKRFQSIITLTENINALCHWWHQDSIVTIPCLRTVSMVYQQRRETER